MNLLITSDPHLGLSRQANFTAESSAAREAASRAMLGEIFKTPHDRAICGGDFFDKFSNPEQVLLESLHYAEQFHHILAGNHDLSNRQSAKSSLEVVNRVLNNVRFESEAMIEHGVAYHFVPHCLTQDLFEHELEKIEPIPGYTRNLLFLHCNYDIKFDQDYSSLTLSRQRAEQLLQLVDHIFIGHVHTPSDHFDNRLHVIGSHFPTAFDNLTDKRHLIYHSDTNEVTSITHWRAAEHVYIGPPDQAQDGRQFYDFTAPADPKLPVRLFKEGALGIRTFLEALPSKVLEVPQLGKLTDMIAADLASDPQLYALWTELCDAD